MKFAYKLSFRQLLCIVLVALPLHSLLAQQVQQPVSPLPIRQTSLVFTENNGQVADLAGNPRPDILFTTHAPGVKLFITATGIHYQFIYTKRNYPAGVNKNDLLKNQEFNEDSSITNIHRVAMEFANANPNPQAIKELETPYVENFYLSHCQQGITNVKTYEKITIKNIYPGIDWVLYTHNNGLKYDLVVNPGADPSVIKIKYTGQDSLQLNTSGQLNIHTSLGTVEENAPVILQGRKKIAGKFKLSGDIVSFNIGNYNKTLPLVIDPEIIWGTYYGDSGYTVFNSLTVNKNDFVFLCGETESTTGIAYNGYKNTHAGGIVPDDAFMVKFDKNGNRIWGTYFGGGEYGERRNRVLLDDSLNIYLLFDTRNFVTLKGTINKINQSNPETNDVYIAKFNANGWFTWGTYYGGYLTEFIYCAAIDEYNNIYFGGTTESLAGISKNGYINTHSPGERDGFLAKFDNSGNHIWSTYYGVSVTGCTIDNKNNLIISGNCDSVTPKIYYNGFKNTYSGGGSDAYIAKLDTGGTVIWSTFYGGENYDIGNFVSSDEHRNYYLTGSTGSKTGISYNGYKNNMTDKYYYSSDVFVAKFGESGNRIWATYLGGDSIDNIYHSSINLNNELYITGDTRSKNYPQKNELKPLSLSDPADGFITKLNSSGNLLWSTYWGTDEYDFGWFVMPDYLGNFYFIGCTTSNNTPFVTNGLKTTITSTVKSNYYLLKFRDVKFYIEDVTIPSKICAGDNIKIKYTTQDTVNAGNIFTFQASDSLGDFTNPIVIGAKASTLTGTDSITLAIPFSVPSGNKYAFRVISSNIADTTYGFGEFKIENPKVKINFSGPQASCAGDSVELKAPVYPGYTYFWQKDGASVTGATQPVYKATQLGNYYLTTFTPSGCWAYSDTLTVGAGTIINAGFSGDTTVCNNVKINFTDTSTVSTGNYKRLWKPSFSDTSSASLFSIGNPVVGSHTITLVITSDAGCKDSVTKSVIINAAPSTALTTDKDTLLCPGDSITLSASTETGNTISWLKNNSPLSATDTFLVAGDGGKYTAVSKSPSNCTDTASLNVSLIQVPQKGFIEIKKNGKQVITPLLCVEDYEYVDLTSSLPGNLLWLPANSSTPVLSASDTGWVYLELTPNSGCKLKDSVHIGDGCAYTLFIPNAFTPGKKDSLNSVFNATGTNIIEFRMEVFSKWGEKLFEADNINMGWDGTYKGTDCSAGIYFYQVVYAGRRNNGATYKSSTKGTITLIR